MAKEIIFKNQIRFLRDLDNITDFKEKLKQKNLYPLTSNELKGIDLSITYKCNQNCDHCHVMSSPKREEVMSKDILNKCLSKIKEYQIGTTELTGGSPELHPDFEWLINKLGETKTDIVLRTNLTALDSFNKKDIYKLLANNQVIVNASLPGLKKQEIEDQRGKKVFDKSIEVLKKLNDVGYGKKNDLVMNLVHNPRGINFPESECSLEDKYKEFLKKEHQVVFNNLFTLTNMPIGRFLKQLIRENLLEKYLKRLYEEFSPNALKEVMCKKIVSVAPDGTLYDCGFNQALNLPIKTKSNKIQDLKKEEVINREININNHCYGCTAGEGSTCYRND